MEIWLTALLIITNYCGEVKEKDFVTCKNLRLTCIKRNVLAGKLGDNKEKPELRDVLAQVDLVNGCLDNPVFTLPDPVKTEVKKEEVKK
jgi:hypothetical protein